MAKKTTKKIYSISNTETEVVLKITKDYLFNEDGEKVSITVDSTGGISVDGIEAGSEEFTLEEFVDLVDCGGLTYDEPLYLGDSEVHTTTDKSGKILSIRICNETITKDDALELMKKLKWIKF